jgi:ATP-dependent 26S proteasome regulatory subunit
MGVTHLLICVGCAKTTLARAVASLAGASFVFLSGADVYSPFVGEAERVIREVSGV